MKSRKLSARAVWPLLVFVALAAIGIGVLNRPTAEHEKDAGPAQNAPHTQAQVQAAFDRLLGVQLDHLADDAGAEQPSRGANRDWPVPEGRGGVPVRCRVVVVPGEIDLRQWSRGLQAVAESAGASVLWQGPLDGERDNGESWRLDVGTAAGPTHTLVLVRPEHAATVHWGPAVDSGGYRALKAGTGPVVALVIDDWGQGKTGPAAGILALPVPLTMAVLPDLRYSRHFAGMATELALPREGARKEGAGSRADRPEAVSFVEVSLNHEDRPPSAQRREVLLHLPMQPEGYPATNPGPGAVLVGMTSAQIGAQLDAALATVPGASGVNNHMGSAATADASTMAALMSHLKERSLFFLDSLTTPRSVAVTEAQLAGVPSARNRIFLDYEDENPDAIAANLETLVRSARAHGFAVGIGHLHAETAAVLTRDLPRHVADGVRFVTVSELMALRRERAANPGG